MKSQMAALVSSIALAALASTPARADEYADTIAVFEKAGESAGFFRNAYGYAVFPTIGKGGVGIGGAYGKGEILGQQGIVVARRTVAKYRESLNIPPVNLRKTL